MWSTEAWAGRWPHTPSGIVLAEDCAGVANVTYSELAANTQGSQCSAAGLVFGKKELLVNLQQYSTHDTFQLCMPGMGPPASKSKL